MKSFKKENKNSTTQAIIKNTKPIFCDFGKSKTVENSGALAAKLAHVCMLSSIYSTFFVATWCLYCKQHRQGLLRHFVKWRLWRYAVTWRYVLCDSPDQSVFFSKTRSARIHRCLYRHQQTLVWLNRWPFWKFKTFQLQLFKMSIFVHSVSVYVWVRKWYQTHNKKSDPLTKPKIVNTVKYIYTHYFLFFLHNTILQCSYN